ncbi:MAG: glutamine--fructose-6-phosphate transaminase (isomerizing) [Candidatus Symbiobacter sp.]|nr:glutamine--fructose-6-phosphate transaminase (isomerizing) [Candidatus Symbiobacter sp.]
MCGIVGIISNEDVAERLLDGLKRLEYRGYDSAGIATISSNQFLPRRAEFLRRRAQGKLQNLAKLLSAEPLPGTIGIGHTRWATHGAATEQNAHPHLSEACAVVHNGIIENYRELRQELTAQGHVFTTDTDTEAVVHLLTAILRQNNDPKTAMMAMMARLHGAFALAILLKDFPDLLIGARRGSPLVVGYGQHEMFLGSDALALAPMTQKIAYLDEGDFALLHTDKAAIFDKNGQAVTRKIEENALNSAMIGKGNHRHFMEKEIFEQPTVVGDSFSSLISLTERRVFLPAPDARKLAGKKPIDFSKIERMTIVACGTSYYAGMVAKYWIEQMAGIAVEIDIASEYRYRAPPVVAQSLSLFISQSGETIDTLSALDYVKQAGGATAAIVNVPSSAMARAADYVLHTMAGPEIGVASTKAFMTQLSVLACLALALGRAKGRLSAASEAELTGALIHLPSQLGLILQNIAPALAGPIELLTDSENVLYMGRGSCYPIALEGALKLKEISYIHAEGFAAGELKHGPIALISEGMKIVALAPPGRWFEKTMSNIEEIIARHGHPIILTDHAGQQRLQNFKERGTPFTTIILPTSHELTTPMIYTLPLQMIAYQVALAKGTDVDQPRNLAKSVTVE